MGGGWWWWLKATLVFCFGQKLEFGPCTRNWTKLNKKGKTETEKRNDIDIFKSTVAINVLHVLHNKEAYLNQSMKYLSITALLVQ